MVKKDGIKILLLILMAFLVVASATAEPISELGSVEYDSTSVAGDECIVNDAPLLNWAGKNVLWLGTSIPHQGIHSADSYPEQFCELMGCTVTNNAFSGSHIRWVKNTVDESCKKGGNAPKGLSATNRELKEKITAALPDDGTSGYDESCNAATSPIRMGYEYRINSPWASTHFDVVVIDHGHNDRGPNKEARISALGTLNPRAISIAGIAKGVVTEITLADGHDLKENDNITIRTLGIPRMDYWTGEVAAVNGNKIKILLNSAAFSGNYTTDGTIVKYDKSKVYDAYNLVISDIYHMNAYYEGGGVVIILMTPPTEWTGGKNDGSIAYINKVIFNIARRWNLPYYNLTADLKAGYADLLNYLPDSVHPITPKTRGIIAKHMAAWAKDGSPNRCKP